MSETQVITSGDVGQLSFDGERVGILGGSFNPVHVGHVKLAEEVQRRLQFEPLWIVPNHQSPLKGPSEIDPEDRLEMVKLGFSNIPNVKISTYELEASGPSYAIHTIEHFKKEHPNSELYFILGTDAFYDLPEWYEFPRLLDECSYIVVTRAGLDKSEEDDFDSDRGTKLSAVIDELRAEELITPVDTIEPFQRSYRCRKGTHIHVLECRLPEVSSTEIRLRLQLGETIKGLVPDAVERYLKTMGLYVNRKSEGNA